MEKPPKSRLDREVDEILERKSKEPIPFRPRHVEQNQKREDFSHWRLKGIIGWQRLLRIPLAMAFALVFLAILLHDLSPLLALLLSTAAVIALWFPGIRNIVKPSPTSASSTRYWRGRPYASEVKSAVSRSPIDSLKRYFDRRR